MTLAKIKPDRPNRPSRALAVELRQCVSRETCIRADEPLAARTTLRVGGAADAYVEPASEEDLARIVRFCADRAVPFFVLGRGSNVLVRDGGVRGVVICLAHPAFSRIEAEGGGLRCGAGARLKRVAAEAKRLAWAGFEFLDGIPGSVGGALRMNAGAMGAAIFDLVDSVRIMDMRGVCRDWPAGNLAVEYRSCPDLKRQVAVRALLRGRPDSQEAIEQRMNAFSRKRWGSQPAAPSAGCIFKNPAEMPAGRLIDELGLKGAAVGGARVSAEHGNFIVTEGGAAAREVLELIARIQRCARESRGIELETEVEIVGED